MTENRAAGVRLLVVVAHPDDETFGCGSTLLHAAAAGATTYVCCATRGEAGEPAPGSGLDKADLGVVRERELRDAADLLGVTEVELLDYRDSGMDGDPAPETLVAADLDRVTADIARVVNQVRPHVVLTLDASDGHRDHDRIRVATLAAVEQATWQVQRVYLHCLTRSLLRRWAEHTRTRNPDSPYIDVDGLGLGTPDEEITTILDTAPHLEQRRRAIAAHASQTSPFAGLPDELDRAFLGSDHLQRLVPPPDGSIEDNLFAGLDRSGR